MPLGLWIGGSGHGQTREGGSERVVLAVEDEDPFDGSTWQSCRL